MHQRIALSFLSALCDVARWVTLDWLPRYVLMSQLYRASPSEPKLSHSRLKRVSEKSQGVLVLPACLHVLLLQLVLSSGRNHTGDALWPLMQAHVPRNQLVQRTCIPHCCGNDYRCCNWDGLANPPRPPPNPKYLFVQRVCGFKKTESLFSTINASFSAVKKTNRWRDHNECHHSSLNMKPSHGTRQSSFLCLWKSYLSLNLSSLLENISSS